MLREFGIHHKLESYIHLQFILKQFEVFTNYESLCFLLWSLRNVDYIVKAPEYYVDQTTGIAHNDMALIKMTRPIPTFPASQSWPPVQTIPLWTYKESVYKTHMAGYTIKFASWGSTDPNNLGQYSDVLMRGEATLLGEQDCKCDFNHPNNLYFLLARGASINDVYKNKGEGVRYVFTDDVTVTM